MKVENMTGKTGRAVANQYLIRGVVIDGKKGDAFQSYKTVIAFDPYVYCGGMTTDSGRFVRSTKYGGQILLDRDKWDCSKTTGRYRNKFLGETKKETQAKIDSGEYLLADLN